MKGQFESRDRVVLSYAIPDDDGQTHPAAVTPTNRERNYRQSPTIRPGRPKVAT
jgi:hypothetical protein